MSDAEKLVSKGLGKADVSAQEVFREDKFMEGIFTKEQLEVLEERFPETMEERVRVGVERAVPAEERVGGEVSALRAGITEAKAREIEAEISLKQANRNRELQRLIYEKLPEDVEAQTAVLTAENALKEAELKSGSLMEEEAFRSSLMSASDFVESLTPMERQILRAGRTEGGQGLIQLWLTQMQIAAADRRSALAEAKTIEEMIRERGNDKAFFIEQIREGVDRVKLGIEEKTLDEDEVQAELAVIHGYIRDLYAIDPSAGVVQYDRVKGWFRLKGIEAEFMDIPLTGRLMGSVDGAANFLVNNGWTGDKKDPVWKEVEYSINESMTDRLTGAPGNTATLEGVIIQKFNELVNGKDSGVDGVARAVSEHRNIMGSSEEVRDRELARLQGRYSDAVAEYSAAEEALERGELSSVPRTLSAWAKLKSVMLLRHMTEETMSMTYSTTGTVGGFPTGGR